MSTGMKLTITAFTSSAYLLGLRASSVPTGRQFRVLQRVKVGHEQRYTVVCVLFEII